LNSILGCIAFTTIILTRLLSFFFARCSLTATTLTLSNQIIGLSQFQAGGIYDPADILIVDRPTGANSKDQAPDGERFAGNKQPKFVPEADPGYFFDGECAASGGTGAGNNAKITSHSCILNLCLGGGGFNCLALYCGTRFDFSPASQPSNTKKSAPSLPPSYPCTIFGGTNSFFGAKGTVDISTITGRTSPRNGQPQSGFITQVLNVISNKPLPPAP
jgi:hypothetical protein